MQKQKRLGTSAQEYKQMPMPDRFWVMEPWAFLGSLHMIWAERGAGKSLFALSMAFHIAAGQKFLGWKCRLPLSVLILEGEMGSATNCRRIKTLALPDIRNGTLDIVTAEDMGGVPWNMATTEDRIKFDHVMRDYQVIIIDNLSCFVREVGKQSEVDAWAQVQPWLVRLRDEGKCIFVIHHAGKSGAQRGTSRREDALDTSISLKRAVYPLKEPNMHDSKSLILNFEKSRHAESDEDTEPKFLTLMCCGSDGEAWFHTPLHIVQKHAALSELEKGATSREVAASLGIRAEVIRRWADEGKTSNQFINEWMERDKETDCFNWN